MTIGRLRLTGAELVVPPYPMANERAPGMNKRKRAAIACAKI